jgi:hypothetical protein
VSGSTVDRPWEGSKSSPALSAPMLWGAGACCKNLGGEGISAELTVVEVGRRGGGVVLATEKQIGGGFFSWTRSLELREMMRNAAKVCEEGGGAVQCLL